MFRTVLIPCRAAGIDDLQGDIVKINLMRFLDAVALALDFRHVAHVDAQARSGVRILGHREGQFIMCLLRRSQDPLAGISVIIAAVQLDANLHIPFHRAAHIPAEHIGHTLDQLTRTASSALTLCSNRTGSSTLQILKERYLRTSLWNTLARITMPAPTALS